MRIAYEIDADPSPGKPSYLTIDGTPFPYHFAPDLEVVGTDSNAALGVRITIYADNVTIRDRHGNATFRAEQRADRVKAAAERARNIVRDGLSDALPWLRSARAATTPCQCGQTPNPSPGTCACGTSPDPGLCHCQGCHASHCACTHDKEKK